MLLLRSVAFSLGKYLWIKGGRNKSFSVVALYELGFAIRNVQSKVEMKISLRERKII